jgi:replicative DNA helicase Mcm
MSQAQTDPDLVNDLVQFLRDYYHESIGELAQKYPNDQRSLWIDWQDVYRFDPDVADDLRNHPSTFVGYFEEALGQYDLPAATDLSDAHVRPYNLPDLNQFTVGAYRSNNIGDLIGVTGQVSKRTKVRPKATVAAFECQRCGVMNRVPQVDGDHQEPHECQSCERQGPFSLNAEQSEWVDHQTLRIQQPPEEVQGGQGVHVDVYVEDDLVEMVETGDRVTINGQMALDEPGENSVAYEPYIDGESVEIEETDYEDIDVDEYIDEIRAVAAGEHGDPFDILVDSIAPKVKGMDEIKEALVLQLFGGVRVEYPDASADRGDSHILLLGDPGTAKSTLLGAVEDIAPRATYASGKGATAAGMTAAAVSDDFGDGKWSLEAGALVIANGGIACVDEIDKVTDEAVNSMHEALEEQRVNVNKAGINTTLPAQTALLAAGNPKHGRFDKYDPIAEQIDLDPALMSRFDLMYMVDDEPDEQRDPEIIDGILQHRQIGAEYTADPGQVDQEDLEKIEPAIPRDALRAYIAHAKSSVTPRMSDDVREHLKEWFTTLRMDNGDSDDAAVPVTFRKLEGVVRLAEASARVRLSSRVSMDDIQRAQRLVLRSMRDVGMDPETGDLDADIIETGTSKSQRDRIKSMKTIIEELASKHDRGAPVDKVVEVAVQNGMDDNKALHEIEKLKQKGEVYEPESDYLRTT